MDNINKITSTLLNYQLFSHFEHKQLESLLSFPQISLKTHNENDLLFMEGETCKNLSVVLDGIIQIQKLDSCGNILVVSTLKEGNVFGENLLFGDKNSYPMSVVCKKKSLVLNIPKDLVYKLCQTNEHFLKQLLRILSNKAITLNSKIKQISMTSLRQMICDFLIMKYRKTNTTIINLDMTKKEWAEKLGVQRPSLSRELIKMKDDGLIDYDRSSITILDVEQLESEL